MLLLQLVKCLVELGARIEDPTAGSEQELIVAVVLELMEYKVHEKDEKIYHLLHVDGFFFFRHRLVRKILVILML